MSPITHFLAGWMVANVATRPRDRIVIAIAGVAPDLDGLGIIPEILTRNSSHPLPWFSEYHHILGHNLGFALFVGLLALLLSKWSWKVALLAFASFHLHLFCDLIGARGPDGFSWPIPYLLPFSDAMQWEWSGQWALNAWQNFAITFGLLIAIFYFAWRRGFSFMEAIFPRADSAFVGTLRKRFGTVGAS